MLALRGSLGPWTCKNAPSNGRPRHESHTRIMAVGDHLAFFLTIQEVVKVLHRNKLVPSVLLGQILELLELPGCHRTRANVAHPATFNHIVEGTHNLLFGRITIQAMNLKNINIRSQTPDTSFNGIKDVFARESYTIHHSAIIGCHRKNGRHTTIVCHAKEALGHDDNALTGNVVQL